MQSLSPISDGGTFDAFQDTKVSFCAKSRRSPDIGGLAQHLRPRRPTASRARAHVHA
jgi:hypothetical protein